MRKAFVFDFDDTLATTSCMVYVVDSLQKLVNKISPSEFNTYHLPQGCHFDFMEFRDSSFIHNADPTYLIHLAKEVADEGHSVYILTARQDDVESAIRVWLFSHGINASYIHCVGGDKRSIAQNKKAVLLDIVENHDKSYFYDDSVENVNVFQHENLRSYLV